MDQRTDIFAFGCVLYEMLTGRAAFEGEDVWLMDGIRSTRFKFDAALDQLAIWSPDGSRIVFQSDRKGRRNLYVKPSSGAGGEELLWESPLDKTASDWSPDGRFILFRPFVEPDAAAKQRSGQWQVSTAGGIFPLWRADGKELYYIGPEGPK